MLTVKYAAKATISAPLAPNKNHFKPGGQSPIRPHIFKFIWRCTVTLCPKIEKKHNYN